MDDLPTPVRHTAHGNLPESCRISSPSPEAMNFVLVVFTWRPLDSNPSFHALTRSTHSSREVAMIKRSSAKNSSQGTPTLKSLDKASSTMIKRMSLSYRNFSALQPTWQPSCPAFRTTQRHCESSWNRTLNFPGLLRTTKSSVRSKTWYVGKQLWHTLTPTVLQVDSSLYGLGAVLMQEGRPIAFASKLLTDTESHYANIERELLAVVYGCERFHTYLYGKPFTAQSDHKPLEMIQLKNLHAAPPRLQRMLLRLQNYDVTIKYQPGKTLLLADGLSRLLGAKQSAKIKLDVAINLVHFSQERVQELRDKTARDPILAPLRDLIISGWPDTFKQVTKPLRPYWSFRDELSIEDGIILKGSEQVLIPAAMQEYILDALHAGHQGRDKCPLRAILQWHQRWHCEMRC